jgi:hypothetical protein
MWWLCHPVSLVIFREQSGHQSPQEEEIRHLKRENDPLRQERDILKKLSASFLAANSEVCLHGFAPPRVPDYPALPGA